MQDLMFLDVIISYIIPFGRKIVSNKISQAFFTFCLLIVIYEMMFKYCIFTIYNSVEG